jgi:hypothetical protein
VVTCASVTFIIAAAAAGALWVSAVDTTAFASGRIATADDPSSVDAGAVVLPAVVSGELPTRWKSAIDEAITTALSDAGLVIASAPGTSCLVGPPGDDCRRNIARDKAARHVIGVEIASEGEGDWAITLRAYAASNGQTVASVEGSCSLCGFEELVELAAAKAALLGTALERETLEPPRIAIASRPGGATLVLDGRPLGTGPTSLEVPPGPHELVVTKPGYSSQTLRFEASAGVERRLEFDLVPVGTRTSTTRRGRGWIIAGAALLGTGVAVLAAGATLLALDGRERRRDCQRDPLGNCRFVYETTAAGIASVAVGGAALLAGVPLLTIGARRHRAAGKRAAVLYGTTLRF